jgi:phosphoribosylformylglycinamidine synthase PurS subunit
MNFRVHIRVMPRDGLLDPQGQAVEHALTELAFDGVSSVRVGRAIEVAVAADSLGDAETATRRMCERLLANPVTEDFLIEVEPV